MKYFSFFQNWLDGMLEEKSHVLSIIQARKEAEKVLVESQEEESIISASDENIEEDVTIARLDDLIVKVSHSGIELIGFYKVSNVQLMLDRTSK